MGVDIEAYRCRIGTFKFAVGNDVVTINCMVNLSGGVKVVGSVLFIGLLLLMSGIESNPGPKDNDAGGESGVIHVSAIPQGVDKTLLLMVFRNSRKHGGGKINNIRFDEEKRSALIQFEDPATVQSVLLKRPIMILGAEVEVDEVTSDAGFQQALCSSPTVEVSGIQMTDSVKSLLEYYFDDEESSGGGNVVDIKITESGNALVTFETLEVAQRVVDQGEHSIQEKTITVLPYTEGGSSTVSMEISSAQLKAMHIEEKKKQTVQMEDVQIGMQEHSESENKIKDIYLDSFEKAGSEADSDTYSDAPGYYEPLQERRDADVERILAKFGLSEKLECKIKISDIVQVDIPENIVQKETTDRDIPFIFLQRLLSGNSDAMNYKLYQGKNTFGAKGSVNAIYSLEERDKVSPLDLFLLVYHCCEPMLKQLLFQKLSLAKLALPFLYQEYPSSKKVLSVWPLRFLLTETLHETDDGIEIRETELLDLPAYVVSFARFGRPRFSKSNLLNGILCDSGSETFFHKDRPLGMTPRYAACGYVEMFFVPFVADGNSQFDKPMIFLNTRGEFHENFNVSDRDFITRTSDTVVVIFDADTLCNNSVTLQKHICRFLSALLIFVSPLGSSEGETFTKLKKFERLLVDRYGLKLHVLPTHTETCEKNSSDIILETKYAISIFLRNKVENLSSLRTRFLQSCIDSDETERCKKAHKCACLISSSIEQLPMTGNLVEFVTPVQSFNSKRLGQLLKESYRNNDPSTFENIKASISSARKLKSSDITHTVKLFTKCLIENRNDKSFLQFYLLWIKLLLDHKKRMSIKDKSCTYDDEIPSQEDKLESNEHRFLEIEDLLREVGHICDSILCSDLQTENIGFPSVTQLGEVFADLVLTGQTLELLDGDSFLIPTEWIKLVLGLVHEKIERKQLLTLSVLGVQSSGKSTLLNTMFGLQFSASSGRCTRGIHMQLIPVRKSKNKSKKKAYEYILIIDTEGIRAPEISGLPETNYRRDNELSTIITGLGDHTILNVMGEGIIEIREILQVLVHAFLRLKLANNHLDIHKSCYLVHQNVSDRLAPVKLRKGLKQTVMVLDNSVKVVADYEGISNIITFNEVIEFNPETNVWYMPNLWRGNPPMATINRKYCEKVSEMTACLLQTSFLEQEKSFKTLKDIVLHMDDLWKGVLAENFVFSFRNSIETKAYIELEKKMKDELWKLDNSLGNALFHTAQKRFSDCGNHDALCESKQEISALMQQILSSLQTDAESNIDTFFKDNNYKDTTIKWKAQSKNRLQIFCTGLIDNSKKEINILFRKREVDIMINNNCKEHEDELRRKSLELANELRTSGRVVEQKEKDLKFDQIWSKFVEESLSADIDVLSAVSSLRTDYIECLTSIFGSHSNLLNPFLTSNQLNRDLGINSLYGSFDKTGITEEDVCITKSKNLFHRIKDRLTLQEVSKEFKMAYKATECLFETIDEKIMHICQKDDLIASRDVKELLNYVESELENIIKHKQHYTLTITFKFKVLVHVSTFSCHRFENENLVHQQSRGIKVRLESYRKQMQEQFYAHLEERKAEETAASLMHRAIEDCIREKVAETLSWNLKGTLKRELPLIKYHLILEMLIEFVQKNDFEQFLSYILNPKGCACIWITRKAKECLFSENSQMYYKETKSEFDKYLDDIMSSLTKSCETISDKCSPPIEEWIEGFKSNCKTLTFPRECFRNTIRELKNTAHVHVPEFRNKISEKLKQSYESLLEDSKSITKDTVKWTGSNPIDTLFEDIWGCPEQCLFCGEPCFRSDKHDDTTHSCLQHRPLGCCGVFDEKTGEFLLQSCNLNVATGAQAPCSMINFKCNVGKEGKCLKKWHPFKEYKEYLPKWDIQPSTDMEDSSKFWMWFIGKYKVKLGEYYNVVISNVPERWSTISDEKAKESLRKLYVAENTNKTE